MEEKIFKPTRLQIPTSPVTIWEAIKCGVFPQALGTLPAKHRVGQGTVIGKRSKMGRRTEEVRIKE